MGYLILPPFIIDEEKALKLRPLSIGSMELMQRFNCGFMDGSMNLGCIVEYIYIHTEDIETLESMSLEAFKEAVRRFKYELSPDEMQRISSLLGMQAQQVDEAAFTVEDSKKKREGTGRTILSRWFGRLRRKRAIP